MVYVQEFEVKVKFFTSLTKFSTSMFLFSIIDNIILSLKLIS